MRAILSITIAGLFLTGCTPRHSEQVDRTPAPDKRPAAAEGKAEFASLPPFEDVLAERRATLVAKMHAGSTSHWRARCISTITGTDLGFAEAVTQADLQWACVRKYGRNVNISEPKDLGCSPNDTFEGCTGAASPIVCDGQVAPPNVKAKHMESLGERDTKRVCASIPAAQQASNLYCYVWSSSSESRATGWCGYANNTSRCPWAATVEMTVANDGASRTYCWNVYNQADHQRDFTLFVN